MKRKLFFLLALMLGLVTSIKAETDYTNLMSSDWTGSTGNFQGGKERYQEANYTEGQKVMYQSFTAPAAGIYEIKFYAVTSSTSGRGFDNKWGPNIAQAYASAGSNKATVAMEVINQTGCTLVEAGNIRTLSVEAAQGETIEYGLENIGLGGNWYTIKELSAKMKTVAEIFQDQYDEAYAIWENSTENELGAKATFKSYVDALYTAMSGTLAEAQTASDNLAAQLVIYENKSYPIKGSGVKYDFTSKMNMAINAWTCVQGNGPAQYGFTGATETYKGSAYTTGDVMYQTITGLANGEYEIHFYGVANSPRGESTSGDGIAYVYANDQTIDIPVIAQDGCTPSDYERTLTVMIGDGTIKYGLANKAAGGNWYVAKNVALYMTGAPDLSDYYDAIAGNLATANSYVGQKMGSQTSTNLNAAISGADGYQSITVIQVLEGINNNLISANTAASASIASYVALNNAILAAQDNYTPLSANEEAYNDAIDAAQDVYDNASVEDCTATINSLTSAMQTANVADYTYVVTNYPYAVNLGTWTTVNATERNGQHWDGTDQSSYSEQDEGWGSSSWSCSYNQDIMLPAGKYVFKVAGRKSSSSATLTLSVTKGNESIGLVSNFPNGDTGKGISTDGAANYGEGSYANNGTGRGWQWRFVEFELTDPATVNVAVTASASAQYQWVGFCNATVQTDDEDNVALMEALVNLNNAIATATLTKNTTNVGSGVFQFNESTNNSMWSAYETAKSNAENYELTSSSTADEVNDLITALTTAISNYINQPLNAPNAEKRYNIIVATTGHAKEHNAVVETLGTTSDNNPTGYLFNASATPNANYAQAVKFTQVSGNTYNISFETSEGVVYLTYGSLNGSAAGWATQQIQGTTDSSKKGEFKIEASSSNNVFWIYNTEDKNYIDCQEGGALYTDANVDYKDFTIEEASQAEPNLTVVAGVNWATFMSPFAIELSTLDAVDAYTTSSVDGTTVDMTPVEDVIPANTPVILYRATTGTNYKPELSGWGTAAANTYVEGLLTGSYVITYIPANSYALQKQNNKVGFYKVSEDNTIQVGANRAYLTLPAETPAREAFFFEDDETGINTIGEKAASTLQDLLNGADVYDLSGRKVTGALEKNKVYIVNGNKIYVK